MWTARPRDIGGPATDEDAALTIDDATLLANDTDADGDTLTISAVDATSANGASITLNNDGTISYDPTGSATIQALGDDETLEDTFTYTISDGNGGTDTATVTVVVAGVNDAPTVTAIDVGTVSEDDAVQTIDLLAGTSDVEGDDLSAINITVTDENGDAVAFTDIGNGTISIDPDQFSDVLDNGDSRTVTVSYDVSDGTDTTPNTATLVVTGADEPNTAPVAVDDVLGDDSEPVSEFLVNEFTSSAQFRPSITTLADGKFVVTWQSGNPQQGDTSLSGVKARIFNADGTEAVSEFLVNEFTNSGQEFPSITALEGGGFVVTWRSNDPQQGDTSGAGVKARIFNADGTEAVSEFLVNEFTNNEQSFPSITALADGGFVVTWVSGDPQQGDTSRLGVKARIFNADGTEAVSEFLVNELTNSYQWFPSITALEGGGFVVTWWSDDPQQGDTSDSGIKARIFNADGTEAVSEFLVNEFTNSHQRDPSITALEGGGFVVTWQSYDPQQGDTSGRGVKARIFNADGTEAVSEFLVNELTNGSQGVPSITALADGGFVVTWHSSDPQQGDASSTGIKARIFNADGTEAVSEFLVNELTNGFQGDPNITALADGGFVVTWGSEDPQQGDTSGRGVKARIFNADGTPRNISGPATDEDTALTIDTADLLANDTDADGDTLTVSAVDATSANGASITLNNDGTISYDPTGSATIQALGDGDTLEDSFTYTISDGKGGTDTATVTVVVAGLDESVSSSSIAGIGPRALSSQYDISAEGAATVEADDSGYQLPSENFMHVAPLVIAPLSSPMDSAPGSGHMQDMFFKEADMGGGLIDGFIFDAKEDGFLLS